jgi:hypothetical protein
MLIELNGNGLFNLGVDSVNVGDVSLSVDPLTNAKYLPRYLCSYSWYNTVQRSYGSSARYLTVQEDSSPYITKIPRAFVMFYSFFKSASLRLSPPITVAFSAYVTNSVTRAHVFPPTRAFVFPSPSQWLRCRATIERIPAWQEFIS